MELNGFKIDKYNQYDLPDKEKLSTCPLCSADRKKNKEKCLMLDWDRGLGTCQHCGEVLQLHTYHKKDRKKEYKKPEFEVKIEAPVEPVMLGEKIKAVIKANYYFGAPVTEASVTYKVLRAVYDSRWYPSFYWDWFYGPGYWWYAYDYPWYPGWQDWGCLRPAWP